METVVIKLPKELKDFTTIQGFLSTWEFHNCAIATEIKIDLTEVTYYDPWAVVLLAAWAKNQQRLGKTISFLTSSLNPSNKYFSQFGLFRFFNWSEVGLEIKEDENALPLTSIQNDSDLAIIATRIIEILKLENEYVQGMAKYCLTELLRNVVQHSESSIGGIVGAQLFKDRRKIQIAVIDIGVGIRKTISRKYSRIKNDLAALKLSLLPHVSSTFKRGEYSTMRDNAGLGLFFTKELARRSHGNFLIASRRNSIAIMGTEDGTGKKKYDRVADELIGTFAVLEVRTNSYDDFSELLQVCRNLSSKARGKERLFSLDFIDSEVCVESLKKIEIAPFDENVKEAARVRDEIIIPTLERSELLILNFKGISFATQSFCHALLHKVFKTIPDSVDLLSFEECSEATKEAILEVLAYSSPESLVRESL